MNSTIFRVGLWSVLASSISIAFAADPWAGAKIMPRSLQVQVRISGRSAGNVYQVSWPASVVKIEGQWLWIEDITGCTEPPVAGWISKEDVLKLDEANDFYVKGIADCDAPWCHWFRGIAMEASKQTKAAKAEYLAYLGLRASDPDSAPRSVVEGNVCYLDAAMRLARLKGQEAKSPEDAAGAASLLHDLADIAQRCGISRPQLDFEQAEALKKAYTLSSSAKEPHEAPAADSGTGGDSTPGDNYFHSADYFYQRMATLDADGRRTSKRCMIGFLGRGELYLERVRVLENEANQTIQRALGEGSTAPGTSDTGANYRYDPAKTEAYVKMLNAFNSRIIDAKRDKTIDTHARRTCDCLASTIASLLTAVDCFNEALSIDTDLIEAYRDRGHAYLDLAQSEAILAEILDARPELRDCLKNLPSDSNTPDKLDRAFVKGQYNYYAALADMKKAEASIAMADGVRKDITTATDAMVKKYLGAGSPKGGDAGGKGDEKADTGLTGTIDRVVKLRMEAASLEKNDTALSKIFADEKPAKKADTDAKAKMGRSIKSLQSSANLKLAERSLHTACLKQSFAGPDELELLASIYSAQCNFDRAAFYQKLATTFAAEDSRPQVLDTLKYYEDQGAAVLAKAKAKAPASSGGGKGAGAGGGADSGGDSGGGDSGG